LLDFFIHFPLFSMELIFFKTPIPSPIVRGGFHGISGEFKNTILAENKIKSFLVDYKYNEIVKFINKNNNINFFIFRVPQHPRFYNSIDDSNEKYFKRSFENFKNIKNCTVMDFGHIYNDDNMFFDLSHLSNRGAKQFSNFLADTLGKINYFDK